MSNEKFMLDGCEYKRAGQYWIDAKTNLVPTKVTCLKLDSMYAHVLSKEVTTITDFQTLLNKAALARDNNDLAYAERCVRQALVLSPDHLPANAILCSILRKQNRPEQAVHELERVLQNWYQPLDTSYAAALCDLHRFEEARQVVDRWIKSGSIGNEMNAVIERIKEARQDLF